MLGNDRNDTVSLEQTQRPGSPLPPLTDAIARDMATPLLLQYFGLDTAWNTGDKFNSVFEQFFPITDENTLFRLHVALYRIAHNVTKFPLQADNAGWLIIRSEFNPGRGDKGVGDL